MAKVLLAGYLGMGNLGDDAILAAFADGAHRMGLEVSALSGNPEETYRLHHVPGVPRRDKASVDKAIAACDALVFPGGSIFQDVTSAMSCKYYADLVDAAKKAKKRVYLVGQGVGPLTSFLGKRWAFGAFQSADLISVRDGASVEALRQLGVRTPVKVTADTAFLLPPPVGGEDAGSFGIGNMKTIGVMPRPLGKKADVEGLIGEFCRLLYGAGFLPVLVPMDRNEDAPLIQRISDKMGGKIPDMKKVASPIEVQRRVVRMDSVVAMRLHGGVLAAGVGVPPLMISYDPKVTAFSQQLGLGGALPVDGLTPTRLFDAFVAFQRDRERNGRLLERKREELAKLAAQNVAIVREALG